MKKKENLSPQIDSKSKIRAKIRVRTPFERLKTGLIKVYEKVNTLVKGQPGQPLTRNQFDITYRFTLTEPKLI